MSPNYQARHALHVDGWEPDASVLARLRRDQETAARAVVVLAQTDRLPASRQLYRDLLLAGALHPQATPSVPASVLIARADHELTAAVA